jgi:DNA-binding GntR family transcriptional regulator
LPVPRPAEEAPAPRRLLRDVVYDKVFYAILDGTLELGERLNDDELVRWLGVSRTPVREAIAKLAEQGLVDIEANRYTRVVAPTYDDFLGTIRTGYDLWSLVMRRGVPNLTDADRKVVADLLDKRLASMKKREREDLANLETLNDTVLAAAANRMLTRLWSATGPLTSLLFQRAAAQDIFPWESAEEFTTNLRDAVLAGDGDLAADIVARQPDGFDDFYEAVRASGIYPQAAR